ncbi:hypothetical protein DFH07DRAFT_970902 [Mycena maculata]|uniref:Multidrug resistance-associated ABC transporter n=1 Tax=Mycena maculata TaxID=230809 RepID=A0AAD7MN83_9AGAR|nr:hypothetical protein DFH07DRAFT_970902 [Mycena maculata]
MIICNNTGAFDFEDACVRSWWSAALPFLVAFTFCVASLRVPWPCPLQRLIDAAKAPFKTFITLQEAVDIQSTEGEDAQTDVPAPVPLWPSRVFAFAGLLQSLAWLAAAFLQILDFLADDASGFTKYLLVSLSWLYTTVRSIASPPPTTPYDLFVLYLLHLAGGALLLGGRLFDYAVGDAPLPATLVLVGLSGNLGIVFVLLTVTLDMPMNLPSTRVKKEDIGRSVSPEDYTRLRAWLTFSWVYPLIKRGTRETLNEKDVWGLSPTMQSRPVFIKFQTIQSASLLFRLLRGASLDMIIDFVGCVLSIVFYYAGPFFLKRILDSIDQPNPTPRDTGMAYMYAGLMFLCSVLKAQCDLQHLWYGRRACTHVRSELMAAIYDKTLKRRDFSGLVKEKEAEVKKNADAPQATKADKAKAKADEKKAGAGADPGKITNLMSNDAEDISFIVATLQFLYGAPFEIGIGSVFLYQLLGWSAFAGFGVFIVCWPLNSYITSQRFVISKERSKAKDKRMAVLDELISSVKFIKFFAWEERWIDRAMAARQEEMRWMVKSNISSIFFSLLWGFAPISLSLVSFFTYIWLGNELTVGTAFTAIALFSMIRAPLNTVPTYLVHVIQARVGLNRIAVYLAEDEVSPQVSSLKQDSSDPAYSAPENKGLGLENASFKWNEVEVEKEDSVPSKAPESNAQSASSSLVDVSTVVDSDIGEPQAHRFELKDISVLFPEGQLSVITGPTASGKTALLMAVMGEMTLLPGGRIIMSKNSTVDAHGNTHGIAYAAQSPWLQHRSIRENILFGSPMDEARYNDVVECCALKPDFEMLEDGDATEIGVKGVSLSGGQKARVALARAVYSRKKYLLLDDPLSAVDSHTSRFLYDKCLRGPLLAHRTVILVTHHVELVLPGAHYLVRMLDGRIDTQGTVKELRAQGVLDEITQEAAVEVKKEELVAVADAVEGEVGEQAEAKKPRKLVEDEHRESGSVKWSVYRAYLSASSYYIWTLLAILVVAQQLRAVTEKIWIKIWAEAYGTSFTASDALMFRSFGSGTNEITLTSGLPHSPHFHSMAWSPDSRFPSASDRPMFYVGVYAAIGLSALVLQLFSVSLQYIGALRASRILFQKLLVTVVRATFRFHDTTPQGKPFFPETSPKDFATIDTRLASSLQAVNQSLAGFFASILTVTIVFPPFLFPAFIIGYLYRTLAIGYLSTGRDLRRMESNTRSPIFSDFGELLTGIVTVRAFSAEISFLDNLHSRIDETSKMWYNFWMTNRWLLLNFDFLGSISVFTTASFAIAILHDDAGLAGLAITSALTFSESVYWACRFWTGLELDLNSVERIIEYTDLPQEPPAIIESHRPPAYWPSSAKNSSLVIVEDLNIKYAPELPSVLQNVSFELKAGERVGLVGRTGSGKSTLAMSLLRFVDPSRRILIDGIDISKIGIHDLRSRVTFIPQDATLFSGSLRDNLDPFGDYEDSACMDALLRVNLIAESEVGSQSTSRVQSVAASPDRSRPSSVHGADVNDTSDSVSTTPTNVDTKTKISLDTQVSAGGTNFSQGQRQLIAMARALLRRSSIVVMDEATSSVDFATDSKIQAAIRAEFMDSLLITVAHRLRTIIDYDRLLVLDKGKVVEFDTPLRLIQKEDGIFRNMCLKSGTFGDLEAAAKAKDYTVAV